MGLGHPDLGTTGRDLFEAQLEKIYFNQLEDFPLKSNRLKGVLFPTDDVDSEES